MRFCCFFVVFKGKKKKAAARVLLSLVPACVVARGGVLVQSVASRKKADINPPPEPNFGKNHRRTTRPSQQGAKSKEGQRLSIRHPRTQAPNTKPRKATRGKQSRAQAFPPWQRLAQHQKGQNVAKFRPQAQQQKPKKPKPPPANTPPPQATRPLFFYAWAWGLVTPSFRVQK